VEGRKRRGGKGMKGRKRRGGKGRRQKGREGKGREGKGGREGKRREEKRRERSPRSSLVSHRFPWASYGPAECVSLAARLNELRAKAVLTSSNHRIYKTA
jgi:hypothetical protein